MAMFLKNYLAIFLSISASDAQHFLPLVRLSITYAYREKTFFYRTLLILIVTADLFCKQFGRIQTHFNQY